MMTPLWIVAIVAAAVLGERAMDPDARRHIRALARSRRRRRAALRSNACSQEQLSMLSEGLVARRRSWVDNMRGGFLALAKSDERTIDEIERKIAALQRGAG
jgi:hypothetical protein